MQEILENVGNLRAQFQNYSVIEKLHDENQRLLEGELKSIIRPILRDVIDLFDTLVLSGDTTNDVIPRIEGKILELLRRNGLQNFQPAGDDAYDTKVHRAVKMIPTGNRDEDRRIRNTIRAGFRWDDGKLFRVADVELYRFDQNLVQQ